MEAINKCRCSPAGKARHQKDKSCNIQQCLTALRSKNLGALYKVAKNPCVCGYEWPSCDFLPHARALDMLAERLKSSGQYVSALSTALSIIRLDPASCVGYCRAVSILRYLLKHSKQSDYSVDTSVSSILQHANLGSSDQLHEVMKRLVKHGLHNKEHHRPIPSDSYYLILNRMGHTFRLDASRKDPVKKLPAEVLTIVFSHLDHGSLIRCLRVNKQWSQAVLWDKTLWTELRLRKPRNPGRPFSDFVRKHPDIRSLAIEDVGEFGMTTSKLHSIFYGLPRLERLELNMEKYSQSGQALDFGIPGMSGAKLTHLTLNSFPDSETVRRLIELTRDTLEVLDVKNWNLEFDTSHLLGTATLPKLKKLRVTGKSSVCQIQLQTVVAATPNLETFYLDGAMVAWLFRPQSGDTAASSPGLWPRLRNVVLGPTVLFPPLDVRSVMSWGSFPRLTSNLRSIEIFCLSPHPAHHILFPTSPIPDQAQAGAGGGTPPPIEFPDLPNLEVFRCRTPIRPDLLRPILQPAAETGTLKVLELAIQQSWVATPDSRLRHLLGNTEVLRPAEELAFARSENLHTLGLHHFNWITQQGLTVADFDGQPFLDWLDCFPSLHTVAVYPGLHENVAPFIMKLIEHPRIRVVHQDILRGATRDVVLAFAEKHGVRLCHTPVNAALDRPLD
ncbi:hypothetical protein VTK26DRAFT_4393 [Humicola hyalothermophila]